ncbi:hypothetical protein SDC9_166104 [bioreactor metagenome]|uniref:Uncharacterized protein n=1 Tax=bioreactor metagenome TaxID=1076179 RepID=A0A645FW32_9ZZZZ
MVPQGHRHKGQDARRSGQGQMGPGMGRNIQREELGRRCQGLVRIQAEVLGDPHAGLDMPLRREARRGDLR